MVHPGAELYGADRMLSESAVALATHFDVTVALPGPGPLVGELESRGLRVVQCRMPVLRNAALRPRGALRLLADTMLGILPALRLLRSAGAAGVYVNTLTLPSWPLLARLAGRRSVCHVHEAEQSAPRLLRMGMAVCPALSDRVVANSRFTRDVLVETAPWLRGRTTVVYNAVPAPDDVRPPRPRLDGPVRLLFVGRLSPRKGPQVAVATLEELMARGVDARLQLLGAVFEGYEWFETELQTAVAEAGLLDRVEFLGFRPSVWSALDASDVVLVPSVMEESFGLTAVEAVMAARPLVVSDSSGLREAVAGCASAQAVVPGDVDRWADAVQHVATDWATWSAAAVADAAEARRRHAPARYAAELVAVLEELSGRPVTPPAGGPTTAAAGAR
ncbi:MULTISPECIES: glycosyltransferase family 4 protein [unclassified Modestobacter]|uniref:glycosyltransferase family 4 protein n=1 Tax=unclassified Modestobacter TaxID=2643866 RepID=UPI0022AA05E6|nr:MULTISPECIES: glycosyltransferase family 4 protein [unclassified Modestobacter]MCZ2825178.1 glycosyltransferase family 4 protein [Modestobacter sp. VKM Ac-2981]MCZ2853757.1 glycosyltransferase family 4 protein [Modestobacter sp. VKM Ac-2982]